MISYEKDILQKQVEMKNDEEGKLKEILYEIDGRFGSLFAENNALASDTVTAILADPKYLRYSSTLIHLLRKSGVSEKAIIFRLVAYFNLASPAKKNVLKSTYKFLPYFTSIKEENGIYEWVTSQGVLNFKIFDEQLKKKERLLKHKELIVDSELRNVRLYLREINNSEESLVKQKSLLQKEREAISIQCEAYQFYHQFQQMPFDAVSFFHNFYPNSYIKVFEQSRLFHSPEFYSCLTTKNNKTVYDIPSNTIYLEGCFTNVFGATEIYQVPSSQYANALTKYGEKNPSRKNHELNALSLAIAPENVARIDSQNFYQDTEKGLTK